LSEELSLRALFPARSFPSRVLFTADFGRLWAASAVSNVGDGVTLVAGPLLVASITTDPAAVAGAVFAQQVPWLLFALVSGAWADRLDRRRLVVTVDLLRACALAALVILIATGTVTVWLIYATFFMLGTGETLADTASSAFVPAIVPADSLPTANSLMSATFTIGNQFAAKPLGAWLFVVAAALPFGVNALTFTVAAVLAAGLRSIPPPAQQPSLLRSGLPPAEPSSSPRCDLSPAQPSSSPYSGLPPARQSSSLRSEIAAGIRWLLGHRLLRTLAVTMAFGNLVFCAAFAIFVLYCRERLGLTDLGYGVLLIAFAAGGLLGTLVAPRLLRVAGPAAVLRAGLFVEVALHATLAATRTPLIAASIIIVFGVHTVVWGVVVTTIRQREVPQALFGRVTSVYSLLDLGGAALGSLLGGAVAQAFGLVATFWAAAAAMAVVAVVAWRSLGAAGRYR
jgi:predicted MFS family arabinose efflux permease